MEDVFLPKEEEDIGFRSFYDMSNGFFCKIWLQLGADH